jgi:hypothetical protein
MQRDHRQRIPGNIPEGRLYRVKNRKQRPVDAIMRAQDFFYPRCNLGAAWRHHGPLIGVAEDDTSR